MSKNGKRPKNNPRPKLPRRYHYLPNQVIREQEPIPGLRYESEAVVLIHKGNRRVLYVPERPACQATTHPIPRSVLILENAMGGAVARWDQFLFQGRINRIRLLTYMDRIVEYLNEPKLRVEHIDRKRTLVIRPL